MQARPNSLKTCVTGWLPRRWLTVGVRGTHGVALTFDDGPHEANTPRILDALAAAGAKATFFVQGQCVQEFPELTRRIHAEGHLLANHGHSHLDIRRVGLDAYMADVRRAGGLIREVCGMPLPAYFRPPFGSLTLSLLRTLIAERFRTVLWSLDSNDSFLDDADELIGFLEQNIPRSGDVVLFHDDYERTADALPALLDRWRDRPLIRVDELLGLRGDG